MNPDYGEGHPASAPLPKDLKFQDPLHMVDIAGGTDRPIITKEEAKHFKDHGYVIKRGLLSNAVQRQKAVEYFWANVPRGVLKKDDPSTWTDSPAQHWTQEDHERVGMLYGTNWKMRSRGVDGIGTETFLVDEIANHPVMISVVQSFFGQQIKTVNRVRGIYAVLPLPEDKNGSLGPHGDYMAAQLSAMTLITDVDEHCGGFTIWPGSHKLLHTEWDTVHGSTISGDRVDGYRNTRDNAIRDITPVEFCGKAGDVVFWHPRLIHSAGVNYSAHKGDPMIRLVVPSDYQIAGQTYVDDLEFGPGPIYQWWVDTRNFTEDQPSTPENMWESWAI